MGVAWIGSHRLTVIVTTKLIHAHVSVGLATRSRGWRPSEVTEAEACAWLEQAALEELAKLALEDEQP
jgi:hypothetical protein